MLAPIKSLTVTLLIAGLTATAIYYAIHYLGAAGILPTVILLALEIKLLNKILPQIESTK